MRVFWYGGRAATPGTLRAAPPAHEERCGCWERHWQLPPQVLRGLAAHWSTGGRASWGACFWHRALEHGGCVAASVDQRPSFGMGVVSCYPRGAAGGTSRP